MTPSVVDEDQNVPHISCGACQVQLPNLTWRFGKTLLCRTFSLVRVAPFSRAEPRTPSLIVWVHSRVFLPRRQAFDDRRPPRRSSTSLPWSSSTRRMEKTHTTVQSRPSCQGAPPSRPSLLSKTPPSLPTCTKPHLHVPWAACRSPSPPSNTPVPATCIPTPSPHPILRLNPPYRTNSLGLPSESS